MKCSFLAAVSASAIIGLALGSCDLLDNTVLIDDGGKITEVDSTTIRLLSFASDSTHLALYCSAKWEATLTDGEGWCTISKTSGSKGRDTIDIFVSENSTTLKRRAQIAVVSGTLTKVYWVVQSAAEEWMGVMYWDRTALQRMGLHSNVDTMKVSDNWHPENLLEYVFDVKGNLLEEIITENNVKTARRLYSYDASNHRLSCSVTDYHGREVRHWEYEYDNRGKYVAYSACGWMDSDPFAEEMDDMIVKDLSGVHKTWTEGGFEFHEDRTYTFEEEYKLAIDIEQWKDSLGTHVQISRDTMRVQYQYSSGKLLPQKGRGYVDNTFYYPNGMLYTMTTKDAEYKFLQNPLKIIVESYNHIGTGAHEIESYECKYNSHHDIVEKKITYSSGEVSIDRYPQYQYDSRFNWIVRYEETSNHERYSKRTFIYF